MCMIDDVGGGWYFHENYYDKRSIVEVEEDSREGHGNSDQGVGPTEWIPKR